MKLQRTFIRRTFIRLSLIVCALLSLVACAHAEPHAQEHLQPKLCGGITDDKIIDIIHLGVQAGYKNSLGCSWNVLETPGAIEFSVYRNSNYMKEINYDKIGHGSVRLYKFKKYNGLSSTTADSRVCEMILPLGSDFVVWTVEEIIPDYNACAVGAQLMNESVLE